MALADLEVFIQERLLQFDSTLDLTSGSPADVQVVQPLLRRLGTDPFTVDIGLFIQELLNQQFPGMPTKEGDAFTDLLIKAAVVLWNPVVREITRVHQVLSFKDPTTLTTDEAEALGANLFATRETGKSSKGTVRVYFAAPQNASVTPANFVTTKTGLHFFPTEAQGIRVEEMLLNLEGSLYYFDIHTIAEAAGDQYNIGPDEVVTIANLASAVRITNKTRFRSGTPDEDAVTFVGRIEQELTERSMVTQRGIVAKVTSEFAEVTRLGVVGFNDPEMQRDVLTGGGLGPILAGGNQMTTLPDGDGALNTRRVFTSETGVDFTSLIGPTGPVTGGYTITLHGAYPVGSLPIVRDLTVKSVVDANTIDVVDEVLSYGRTALSWVLRKNALTLSGIPGGILFPDSADGTVSVPDNQIHIGGATDIYVRGQSFDSATLVLTDIVDDQPLLAGTELVISNSTNVYLHDFILAPGFGSNYAVGDATYMALAEAAAQNLSIQILDPPNAGSYRITHVSQAVGSYPLLTVSPALPNVVGGDFRWRVSSSLFIDLTEPKETRVSGSDLRAVQGASVIDTTSGVDFDTLGVSQGDILRILNGGLIKGDYEIQQVLSPLFTHLQLDRALPATVNGAQYLIFRPNADGGLVMPFVRVDSIDLLDTSSQPVGSKIPYARPVDVRSNGFANVARGIKADVTDAVLGIVSLPFSVGANVNGLTLQFLLPDYPSPGSNTLVPPIAFSGTNPMPISTLVSQLNAAAAGFTGGQISRVAVLVPDGTNARVGILPVTSNVQLVGGSARLALFGFNDKVITSRDITSQEVSSLGGWAALRPALDKSFDVVQSLDGLQVGFYGLAADAVSGTPVPNTPFSALAYDPLRTARDFNPEIRRHVQVGARSLGTARAYFLDPTSFEVDPSAVFTLTQADGSTLRFFPDPTNSYQRVPPLPSGVKPLDGETGGSLAPYTFSSASTDFIAQGIQKGDSLVIDFVPLVGTAALADPIVTLNARTLILSLNGGADKTIIFIHDNAAIPATDVTRQGAVDQINKTIGQVICSLSGTNHLTFNPDAAVTVRATGTANTLLGFSALVDQNNDSPNKGTYVILTVGPAGNVNQLVTDPSGPAFPSGFTDVPSQQFKVFRAGLQRICSTDMAKNVGTASLYFFDVQLVSEGTGDQYNIPAALQLDVTGFRSDGYYLTTVDSNLAFSSLEKPRLHLSKSILEVGVSDDPNNATQLAGQNIQINYERSALTNDVNNFALSETERVINESPLARHLIPYFVRFSLTYFGGSKEDVVIPDLTSFIEAVLPDSSLEVSDLERIVQNRGARAIENPVDLIAVIHNVDRTITVERSQDKLNTGRLAAFIPDVLLVTRRIN